MSTPASANQLPGWVIVIGVIGLVVCLDRINSPKRAAAPTAPHLSTVPAGLKSRPVGTVSQTPFVPPPRGPITVPCPNSQCFGGLVTNINGPNTICGVCGGRVSVTRY